MTYDPSDELMEKLSQETWNRYGMRVHSFDSMLRAYLQAAIDSGELVPRSWLEPWAYWNDEFDLLLADGEQDAYSGNVPLYRIVEPAQPNDGGE